MTQNKWDCEPVWKYNGLTKDFTQSHTLMSINVNNYHLERLWPVLAWLYENYGKPDNMFDYETTGWYQEVRKTTVDILKFNSKGNLRKGSNESTIYELRIRMNDAIFSVFKLTWGLTPIIN